MNTRSSYVYNNTYYGVYDTKQGNNGKQQKTL